ASPSDSSSPSSTFKDACDYIGSPWKIQAHFPSFREGEEQQKERETPRRLLPEQRAGRRAPNPDLTNPRAPKKLNQLRHPGALPH
uniref:Uncharacterized protein n=1 Tax=Mustela putorius furo TaxID=9669 RepID=M3YNE1_MUSPF